MRAVGAKAVSTVRARIGDEGSCPARFGVFVFKWTFDVHATGIPLANGMPLPKAGLFAEKEGEAVAARIAARLRGDAPTATTARASCPISPEEETATVAFQSPAATRPAFAASVRSFSTVCAALVCARSYSAATCSSQAEI